VRDIDHFFGDATEGVSVDLFVAKSERLKCA
jgi:hypothetical protein